jgi:hypothetical protein
MVGGILLLLGVMAVALVAFFVALLDLLLGCFSKQPVRTRALRVLAIWLFLFAFSIVGTLLLHT